MAIMAYVAAHHSNSSLAVVFDARLDQLLVKVHDHTGDIVNHLLFLYNPIFVK
jgi:hypothetical protein